jgi:hypothetical protein
MEVMELSAIVAKWNARTSIAGPEYEAGVRSPKTDWASATAAAKDNYKAGVTEAIAAGSFEKGVRAAGTPKWQERTLTLGVARWPSGVAASQDSYRSAIEPFISALRSLALPPRYAKGDARNLQRVNVIATALHKLKMSRGG